jgi:CRISPR-associated protein Csm1
MALKADIDKLGDTFRELYREDFRLFNRLSREVEFFFSNYITHLISKRDNIYTVFAGGDDLFLIGEYKEIIELAKEIREEFLTFSLGKTTISMGVVMFKPTTPINFVSEMADRAERRAKIERDSIDIFGVSMRFKEFNDIEDDFNKVVEFLEKERDDKTTFYYKLIELCDMRERLDNKEQSNPQDALWKSKLNYLFRRNVKQKDNDSKIFTKLNNLIEKGEKFKPSIFLQIYKNRDKKKEKRDD